MFCCIGIILHLVTSLICLRELNYRLDKKYIDVNVIGIRTPHVSIHME